MCVWIKWQFLFYFFSYKLSFQHFSLATLGVRHLIFNYFLPFLFELTADLFISLSLSLTRLNFIRFINSASSVSRRRQEGKWKRKNDEREKGKWSPAAIESVWKLIKIKQHDFSPVLKMYIMCYTLLFLYFFLLRSALHKKSESSEWTQGMAKKNRTYHRAWKKYKPISLQSRRQKNYLLPGEFWSSWREENNKFLAKCWRWMRSE